MRSVTMVSPVTSDVISVLEGLGFFEFLLPWLFMFAVTFGILSNVNLFGDNNKRISAAIALVVAFFTVGFAGPAMASFFIDIFGGASLIIAGILVIVLFIGMVGFKASDAEGLKKTGVLIVLIIIGIVLWFLSVGAAGGAGFSLLFSPALISLIIVVVVIVLAVWMIMQGPKEAAAKPQRTPGP